MSRYTSKTSELRAQRAERDYSELVDLRAERDRLRRLLIDCHELLTDQDVARKRCRATGEYYPDGTEGSRLLAAIEFERGL